LRTLFMNIPSVANIELSDQFQQFFLNPIK
jgi:hypothetical protein